MCTDLQWITDARIISVPNRHSHLKYSPGGSFNHFRKNIAFFHPENKSSKNLLKKTGEKKKIKSQLIYSHSTASLNSTQYYELARMKIIILK